MRRLVVSLLVAGGLILGTSGTAMAADRDHHGGPGPRGDHRPSVNHNRPAKPLFHRAPVNHFRGPVFHRPPVLNHHRLAHHKLTWWELLRLRLHHNLGGHR